MEIKDPPKDPLSYTLSRKPRLFFPEKSHLPVIKPPLPAPTIYLLSFFFPLSLFFFLLRILSCQNNIIL